MENQEFTQELQAPSLRTYKEQLGDLEHFLKKKGLEKLLAGYRAERAKGTPALTAKSAAAKTYVSEMIAHFREEYARLRREGKKYTYEPMERPAPVVVSPVQPAGGGGEEPEPEPPQAAPIEVVGTTRTCIEILAELDLAKNAAIAQLLTSLEKKGLVLSPEERAAIGQTETRVVQLMRDLEAGKETLSRMRTELPTQIEAKYATALRAGEEENVRLSAEVAVAREQRGEFAKEAVNCGRELDSLKRQLDAMKEQKESAENEAAIAKEDVTGLKLALDKVNASIQSGAALDETLKIRNAELALRNDDLGTRVDELKRQLDQATLVRDAATRDAQDRGDQLASAQVELTRIREEATRREDREKNRIGDSAKTEGVLRDEIATLRNEVNNALGEIDRETQQRRYFEERANLCKAEVDALQSELAEKEKGEAPRDEEEARSDLVDLQESVDGVQREQVRMLREQLDSATDKLARLGAIRFWYKNAVMGGAARDDEGRPLAVVLDDYDANQFLFDPTLFRVITADTRLWIEHRIAELEMLCAGMPPEGGGGDTETPGETRLGGPMTLGESVTKSAYVELASLGGTGANRLSLAFVDARGARALSLSAIGIAPQIARGLAPPEFVIDVGKGGHGLEYSFVHPMLGRDLIPAKGRITLETYDRAESLRRITYAYALRPPTSPSTPYGSEASVTFADGTRLYATYVTASLYQLGLVVVPAGSEVVGGGGGDSGAERVTSAPLGCDARWKKKKERK
jgi:hypothetical protein